MKKTAFFAFALLFLSAEAQQYKVSGTAPAGAKVVYLQNAQLQRGESPDSVVLGADRTFAFEGDAAGKMIAQIFTDREAFDALPLVLDGNVSVDFDKATMQGTEENNALCAAYASLRADYAEMAAINKDAEAMKARGELNQQTIEPLMTRYEAVAERLTKEATKIANENTKRIFPAYFFRDYYPFMDRTDLIRWADEGAAFMKLSALDPIKSEIAGWKLQEVGSMFVDIEEPDTDGKLHKLSEYVGRGNYVLVDFWASWCGPCMGEVPNVKAAYDKYHEKGFEIVGLSFDQDKKAWMGAIERKGMNWIHLSDLKGWNTLAAKTYGINSIPATILYGPDGRVVASNLRGDALEKTLQEIYQKQ